MFKRWKRMEFLMLIDSVDFHRSTQKALNTLHRQRCLFDATITNTTISLNNRPQRHFQSIKQKATLCQHCCQSRPFSSQFRQIANCPPPPLSFSPLLKIKIPCRYFKFLTHAALHNSRLSVDPVIVASNS